MIAADTINIIDYSNNNINTTKIISSLQHCNTNDIIFLYLGKRKYKPMWEIQKQLHHEVKNSTIPNIIMYLEHEHVYTFGKNANKNYLLNTYPETIDVIESDRGGQVTYHGPGQLVGYPIINLNFFNKSISWYMRSLEDIIIDSLSTYQIESKRKEGLTGVWVEDDKICAMGVRISRWVTMHGFALNINPEMKYYDSMIPCGIFDYGVTSISEISNIDISIFDAMNIISERFIDTFKGNA